MKKINFIDDSGSFTIEKPENVSGLYFPLASETGLKSSVTPNLGGDAKLDQESFLLEPVSSENLHNNRSTRNFWFAPEKGTAYSAAGASVSQEAFKFSHEQDESEIIAGFMWHTLMRTSKQFQISTSVTSFIPRKDNTEIMYITIENKADTPQSFTPYAAIPIYGRSADNIRDHRNVTSMLHRINTDEKGVYVCPTMSFDEKGHRPNSRIYYVIGCTGQGENPVNFYPAVEDFIGEGGTYTHPRAVYEQYPGEPPFTKMAGKEAMGAFRFSPVTLSPGEKKDFIILFGIDESRENIEEVFNKYNSREKIKTALDETKTYWQNQVAVSFHTDSNDFDSFMKWVCFQPFLRRLFGCSFLPHHDYGRGGRGWRDLWQDCLSLLLLNPGDVGQMIEKNYGGVRIDGTNATIIGEGDGNFIADRNGIARVWMDHALWPFMTTKLYINQTGDVEILNKPVSYFKDAQAMRGTDTDSLYNPEKGNIQLTKDGEVYMGSILEHLLIQHLTAFYEVGEHNMFRLRGADWNDALDMASERGESVAFTCAYAGNLLELAETIRLLESRSQCPDVWLSEEMQILLNQDSDIFDNPDKKREILSQYASLCRHSVSGKRIRIPLSALALNLVQKANWLMDFLRKQEWLNGPEGEGWFNSYYDNHGQRVEGFFDGQVRMMLTGQVFAIMSGVAEENQIKKIAKSADKYLYQEKTGGYRLNTDFKELKFDMGRMFGFAYGEKENGAVFSHMTVMYANALYRRGFVKEGYKALKTLAGTALDFDTSHIYPGIPEYFRLDGRGMYQYLTGAASWFMMTMITEVFGVRGEMGDLLLYPKLLACQFDEKGHASISVPFAGKNFHILYENKQGKDFGTYIIEKASCDGRELTKDDDSSLLLSRQMIDALPGDTHEILIQLN